MALIPTELEGSKEELEAECGLVHRNCLDLLANRFSLPLWGAEPISVSLVPVARTWQELDTGVFGKGAFDINPNRILFTRKNTDGLDCAFTIAHETGHYLHYLANPGFHRGYNHDHFYSDHRRLVIESVADLVAWEYFKLIGRAEEYLGYVKKEVLSVRDEVNSKNELLKDHLGDDRVIPFVVYALERDSSQQFSRLSSMRFSDRKSLIRFRQRYREIASDLIDSVT